MFRYEKPQKGRYRQFSQIGAEAFGFVGPDVDAELIAMSAAFWQGLGIQNHVRLELNTLGAPSARQAYREALVAFLQPRAAELDADSQRRLQTNPLRILDSKEPATQAVLSAAPRLSDYVDEESAEHFRLLCTMLDALGVKYQVNERLVRGLDYYTHTVFEWVTDDLGAQGTVCAGGRYDGLVAQLGGHDTPAAGFAMGVDRVVLLHEKIQPDAVATATDVYLCYMDARHYGEAVALANELRSVARVNMHLGGGALKKQLKKAAGSGAHCALILGEDEIANAQVTVKYLATGQQERVERDQIAATIAAAI